MEAMAKSADKEKTSLVTHLRRQVASAQKDLAERQEAMKELEKENHSLLKNMKSQVSRAALNGIHSVSCLADFCILQSNFHTLPIHLTNFFLQGLWMLGVVGISLEPPGFATKPEGLKSQELTLST